MNVPNIANIQEIFTIPTAVRSLVSPPPNEVNTISLLSLMLKVVYLATLFFRVSYKINNIAKLANSVNNGTREVEFGLFLKGGRPLLRVNRL